NKSFWHMYVRVTMEDGSRDKKKIPQRYVTPLGFEMEVDLEHDNENVEELKIDKTNLTPPPIVRSVSSFPFRNHTFTDWCVKRPSKWKRKFLEG
ncbi:2118_t:CDS:1, partial [Acaulospora morrowiae]